MFLILGESGDGRFASQCQIHKIVYSRTVKKRLKTAELKRELIKNEIVELKKQPGKNIVVGSPSLIVQLGNLGLVDQYQIAIHPLIAGAGLSLFKDISAQINLKLLHTKVFGCGALLHCYEVLGG